MKNFKKKKFNFPFYVFGLRWKSKGLEKKFIWLIKKKKIIENGIYINSLLCSY